MYWSPVAKIRIVIGTVNGFVLKSVCGGRDGGVVGKCKNPGRAMRGWHEMSWVSAVAAVSGGAVPVAGG